MTVQLQASEQHHREVSFYHVSEQHPVDQSKLMLRFQLIVAQVDAGVEMLQYCVPGESSSSATHAKRGIDNL
jgi:hypothetical protein